MPRTCSVCRHAERSAINKALVAGHSARDIAGRFQLSSSAVDRHKREHLPATMAKAAERREVAEAVSLVDQLHELGRETRAVLEVARSLDEGGPQIQLKAIQRLERQIELYGRLAGQLREPGDAGSALQSAEWLLVREAIARALDAFPEARQAVADALADFEAAPESAAGDGGF